MLTLYISVKDKNGHTFAKKKPKLNNSCHKEATLKQCKNVLTNFFF